MSNDSLKEISTDDLLKMQKDMLRAQALLRPSFLLACKDVEIQLEKKSEEPEGRHDTYQEEIKLRERALPYIAAVQAVLDIEQVRLARQAGGVDRQP